MIPARPVGHYQRALSLYTELGHIPHTAVTLDRVGHPHAALGEYEQPRAVWRKSQELYRRQERDQDVDRIQNQLDALAGGSATSLV